MVQAAMIIDAFIFSDELDMLECRLIELQDVVDRFVLVEGDKTFQGEPKPSVYRDNQERFAQWSDRIVHVIVPLPRGGPWAREHAQREGIAAGLAELAVQPSDTVIVSDVDEIWRSTVDVTRLPKPFTVLTLAMYVHNLGWLHPDPWDGPVVVRVEDIPAQPNPFEIIRSCRLHPRPVRIPDAGWHLSWFGGDTASRRKQWSFSHTEYRDVDMARQRANGLHIDGTVLVRAPFPNDVPAWIPAGWMP
jgi:beta-1,4-mannosyl-glycoprotein beta-1,4-N-acetylglucosaminyltransferase